MRWGFQCRSSHPAWEHALAAEIARRLSPRRNRLTGLIPSSKGLELTQLALTEYAANLFDAVIRP